MGATFSVLTHQNTLKKKGVKGTSVDGPVKVHPKFARIQWIQNQSHMPRGLRVLALDAERVEEDPMDVDALAAVQGREEEPVTIGCSEYEFLCDEMSFFRYEIKDIRQGDREDQYLGNQHLDRLEQRIGKQEEMLRAILEQLPPALGASSSAPQGEQK
jgi:hypothetical protein